MLLKLFLFCFFFFNFNFFAQARSREKLFWRLSASHTAASWSNAVIIIFDYFKQWILRFCFLCFDMKKQTLQLVFD